MNNRTKDMAFIAICVAILVVMSQISIPTPSGVPLTLQTFGVAFIGYFLGIKKGLVVLGCYLLLGIIGIPVFANFKGGFQIIVGPTGGFLIGFIFLLIGVAIQKKKKILSLILGNVGLLFCHLIGILWFASLTKRNLLESFLLVSLPYIIKDIISVILGYAFASIINKKLKL